MMYREELSPEKDRFSSRLASIPGIQPMPSIGDWIMLHVRNPADLARKLNRRLEPGAMQVPRGSQGSVRVHIGEPKQNDVLYRALRDICA